MLLKQDVGSVPCGLSQRFKRGISDLRGDLRSTCERLAYLSSPAAALTAISDCQRLVVYIRLGAKETLIPRNFTGGHTLFRSLRHAHRWSQLLDQRFRRKGLISRRRQSYFDDRLSRAQREDCDSRVKLNTICRQWRRRLFTTR